MPVFRSLNKTNLNRLTDKRPIIIGKQRGKMIRFSEAGARNECRKLGKLIRIDNHEEDKITRMLSEANKRVMKL